MQEIPVESTTEIPTIAVPNTVFLVYHATLKEVVCSRVSHRIYHHYLILENGEKVGIRQFSSYEGAVKRRHILLEIHQQKTAKNPPESATLNERQQTVWTLYEEGVKPSVIAEHLNLSTDRVRQIIISVKRKIARIDLKPE